MLGKNDGRWYPISPTHGEMIKTKYYGIKGYKRIVIVKNAKHLKRDYIHVVG